MCEGASIQSADLKKIIPRHDRAPRFKIPGSATSKGPSSTCLLVVINPEIFRVLLSINDSNVMFTSSIEKGGNFIQVSGFYLVTPILWSLHVFGPPDFIPDRLKF